MARNKPYTFICIDCSRVIYRCSIKPEVRDTKVRYTEVLLYIVFPDLSYPGITCWISTPSSRLKCLTSLHKHAIHVTCLLGWSEGTNLIFKEHSILKRSNSTKLQIRKPVFMYLYRRFVIDFFHHYLIIS